MKVSILRETMGGRLELVTHFPAGDMRITRLSEASDQAYALEEKVRRYRYTRPTG